NYLEKITAKAKQRQVNLNFIKAIEDVQIAYSELMSMVQSEDSLVIAKQPLKKEKLQLVNINETPEVSFFTNSILVAERTRRLEKQQLLPDITLNYFQGTNSGINRNLRGYQLGLKIPLLFTEKSSKIKASKIAEDIAAEK
ncbi:hypothetical protein H4O21_24355, partial [Oceanospirillum sp. D5]|nr:hypothetical protein [Oceanospirillum sediminis]